MSRDNASCVFLIAAVLWAALIAAFMWCLFSLAVFIFFANGLELTNELVHSLGAAVLFGDKVKLHVL